MFLKKVLNSDCVPPTKNQFLEAISKYLSRRTSLVSRDISNFCICGGKSVGTWHRNISSHGGVELLDLQHKQLEVLVLGSSLFGPTTSRLFAPKKRVWNEKFKIIAKTDFAVRLLDFNNQRLKSNYDESVVQEKNTYER